jgi:hypothetical protein
MQGLSLGGSKAKLFQKEKIPPRNTGAKLSQKRSQIVLKKPQPP